MLDAIAWSDLGQLVPQNRRPIVDALKTDYQLALEQIQDRLRDAPPGSGQVGDWEALLQIQAVEAELWKHLSAVIDVGDELKSVRRSWMRRGWLESVGARNLVFSTGIDLAGFVRADWQTRQILDAERLEAGVPGSAAEPATPLSDLLAQYEIEMGVLLDQYRRAFGENAMQAAKTADGDRKSELNLERHLMVTKPYALTRRFADRASAVVELKRGKTAAVAWRERFLRSNDSALFWPARGAESIALGALEDHAWNRTDADRSLLILAERRWSASGLLHDLVLASLRDSREQPPVISNVKILVRVAEIAEWMTKSLEEAARSIGCLDAMPKERAERWIAWFPKPPDPDLPSPKDGPAATRQ